MVNNSKAATACTTNKPLSQWKPINERRKEEKKKMKKKGPIHRKGVLAPWKKKVVGDPEVVIT